MTATTPAAAGLVDAAHKVGDPHDDVAARRRAPRRRPVWPRRRRRSAAISRRTAAVRTAVTGRVRGDEPRSRSPRRCSPPPRARTESRGCHRRTDHPSRDRNGSPTCVVGLAASLTPARSPSSAGRARAVRGTVGLRCSVPSAVGADPRAADRRRTRSRRRRRAGPMAVTEDLMGGEDVTSVATVPADQRSVATFGSRGDGVVAGLAGRCRRDRRGLRRRGVRLRLPRRRRPTGRRPGPTSPGSTAPTRLMLTAERSALNLLCHLSGVATLTRRWADALAGTAAMVRDTRKTTPGLRALEKYAVRMGGGANHRMGLSDAALVKDNHVMAAGGVAEAFAAVRALEATIPVEIEVDSLDGLAEALEAGADVVLLDNFDHRRDARPRWRSATRAPGRHARGERRPDAEVARRRRDRRRLHRRRRAHPLRQGPRHRPRPRRRALVDAGRHAV